MNRMCNRNRHRWLIRLAQVVALSVLLSISITWAGSTIDHPIDTAITAGMTSPECAEVRAMPAGSLLSAALPNNDVCRSFFLYRATFSDATDNAGSYEASVMQDRIDEFWQLIGYVGLLSFAAVGIAFTLAAAARIAYRRYRGVAQRQGHPKRCDATRA